MLKKVVGTIFKVTNRKLCLSYMFYLNSVVSESRWKCPWIDWWYLFCQILPLLHTYLNFHLTSTKHTYVNLNICTKQVKFFRWKGISVEAPKQVPPLTQTYLLLFSNSRILLRHRHPILTVMSKSIWETKTFSQDFFRAWNILET